jgi:hypothetical protein
MYRVEWLQNALNGLAGIWIAADPLMRQQIVLAANEIDRKLAADPLNESETRPVADEFVLCFRLPWFFELSQATTLSAF